MFDVGFTELALIFGVSLVVLGPKKLPGLVKKVGRWVGKARSMARDFQQQLENEVNLEELNNITNQVARETQQATAPPDFTSDPPATETSTYPYSAQDSGDTYSHAHAEGDAPMPDVQEFAAAETSRHDDVPVQADLDLSDPEDPHRPPDEAHHNS